MARLTGIERANNRIHEILGEYAASQGWSPDDWNLYSWVNKDWGNLHVIFVSKGFNNADYYNHYDSVMNYLTEKLSDDPDLLGAIGLVIRTPDQVQEGGIYAIGEEYEPMVAETA
jgi:hypothetical protein